MVSFTISGIIDQRLLSLLVVDVIFVAENISIIPKLLPKGDYQSKRTHLCQSTATLRPPLSCRRRGSAQNFERSDSAAVAPEQHQLKQQHGSSSYSSSCHLAAMQERPIVQILTNPLKKKKKRANFSGGRRIEEEAQPVNYL